jgi:hypothetical protein
VFLLKLCWDGGKDEMTACVSRNALEASMGICSARFDGSEIFIEFVIGLKNDVFACFNIVPLMVSMDDTHSQAVCRRRRARGLITRSTEGGR